MASSPKTIRILPCDDTTLKLRFPYDHGIVEKVRQLPKRRWSKPEKCWFIPNDAAVVGRLLVLVGPDRVIDQTAAGIVSKEPVVPVDPAKEPACPHTGDPAGICGLIAGLDREMKVKNYSIRTRRNYRDAVQRFCEDMNADPGSIGPDQVKQYLIHLREKRHFSPRTVNLWAAAINFFYRTVVTGSNPVASVPRMKVGRPLPDVYSEEEIGAILGAAGNPKHRLILMLAYGCGLRLGEIRSLTPEDISLDRRVLTVRHGKGNKDRRVMIDEVFLPALDAYLRNGRGKVWLFEGPSPGHRLTARTISLIFEHACQKAGIVRKSGIHGLRHSFATHLMEHGTGLRSIQELLGHSSNKTTEIYTHVSKSAIAKIRSPLSKIDLQNTGRIG